MSNRSRPASTRKGGAPASALLGASSPPVKIIEGETATTAPPTPPTEQGPVEVDKDAGEITVPLSTPADDSETKANEAEARQREVLEHQALVREGKLEDVSLAEHKRKQAEYRAQVEAFAAELNSRPAPDAPETDEGETPEELAVRLDAERMLAAAESARLWLESYAEAVAADRDAGAPLYVVGTRAPRPKWQGVMLNIGDVVPGAHRWPRLESWVNTGVVQARAVVLAG